MLTFIDIVVYVTFQFPTGHRLRQIGQLRRFPCGWWGISDGHVQSCELVLDQARRRALRFCKRTYR